MKSHPSQPARRARRTAALCLLAAAALLSGNRTAQGINITGYDPAVHDRFTGVFPSAPAENSAANAIRFGVDLTGVGWNPAFAQYQVALISGRHLLLARHLTEPDTSYAFFGGDGAVHTYAKQSEEETGEGFSNPAASPGDLSIGTLADRPDPLHGVEPLAILDAPAGSGAPVIVYGRGASGSITSPRMVETTIAPVTILGAGGEYLTADESAFDLVAGDSQGPLLREWVAPDGEVTFTIRGNSTATTGDYSVHNDLGHETSVAAVQPLLADDGLALRWVRTPDWDWDGSQSGSYGERRNWAQGTIFDPTPDGTEYAGFDSDAATNKSVDLGGVPRALRGIVFAPGSAGGFSFANGTFQLARGGMANFDADDTPAFSAGIQLTDHQHWYAKGASGFTVSGPVDTNGKRLVLSGAGSSAFSGAISGAGGIAVDTTGSVTLSGNSNGQSGATWVYAGTLVAANASGSATGTGALFVEKHGKLSGSGRIAPSGNANIEVRGRLEPSGVLALDPDSGQLLFGATAVALFDLGTVSDRVAMGSDAVQLAGVLEIAQGAGFDPAATYPLFSGLAQAPGGAFASVAGLPAGHAAEFSFVSGEYRLGFFPASYAAWQARHFTPQQILDGEADPGEDPEDDGAANGVEFSLGLDPLANDAGSLPQPALQEHEVMEETGEYLTLTFSRDTRLTGVTYIVETAGSLSHNPEDWTAVLTASGSAPATGPGLVEETGTTVRTAVARDTVPLPSAAKRFMRLRIEGL